MKIVSPFRDYYDSAQAYGHDEARFYERVSRTTLYPANVWPYSREILERLDDLPNSGYYLAVHCGAMLLMCGRAWPVFGRKVHRAPFEEDLPRRVGALRVVPEWIRFYEEARATRNPELAEEANRFFDPAIRHSLSYYATQAIEVFSSRQIVAAQERLAAHELGSEVLIGEGAPCVLLIPEGALVRYGVGSARIAIVTNPRLSDLGFQRILDPYACYQAIETFLGSQLAPPDLAPQRVGSDDVVARQKGFDEHSFRTAAPGAKKENRARNRERKRGG